MPQFNSNFMLRKSTTLRSSISLRRAYDFCSKRLINNYASYESITDEFHDPNDLSSCNKLITKFTKSGNLQNAREVFDKMPVQNVVTWSALISGYGQNGMNGEALTLFSRMVQCGVNPNHFTFPSALNSCANILALRSGKEVHGRIITTGFESNIFVGSSLVDLYAKCRSLEDARQVFEIMPYRNVVSWNAVMGGYAKNGLGEEALKLLCQMQEEDIKQDGTVLVTALVACGSSTALLQGKMIHAQVLRTEFYTNSFVGNAIVDMYAKCGVMRDAHTVFDRLSDKDVVSWTAMIAGYVQNGYSRNALKLFQELLWTDVKPDPFTLASAQSACANLALLELGKQLHTHIISFGCELSECAASSLLIMYAKCGSIDDAAQVFESMPFQDLTSWNAMVDMYSKCGAMKDANQLFNRMSERDVVSWTAMIVGYVQSGYSKKALKLYQGLLRTEVKPDPFTFASIQSACANLALLKLGQQLHTHIIRSGCESSESAASSLLTMYAKCGSVDDAAQVFESMPSKDLISWNVMVDMYAKCGAMKDAHQVFDKMSERDVVTWTSMIAGYVRNGCSGEALKLYQKLIWTDVKPDVFTFASIQKACANLALLELGKGLHTHIIQRGCESSKSAGSSLVNMYARCGRIDDAAQVLERMASEHLISWNTILKKIDRRIY